MASGGSISALFERPIALVFLATALAALLWPLVRRPRSMTTQEVPS